MAPAAIVAGAVFAGLSYSSQVQDRRRAKNKAKDREEELQKEGWAQQAAERKAETAGREVGRNFGRGGTFTSLAGIRELETGFSGEGSGDSGLGQGTLFGN